MNDSTINGTLASPGLPLRAGLWFAQLVVAGMFIMAGTMKLVTPVAELSAMMPWTGEFSEQFVRGIGLIDLAGGIGILLPALTRIMPKLTVWAAIGCVVLQICAIIFHASRGEFSVLGLNFILLPCAAFVWWGRSKRVPILPR